MPNQGQALPNSKNDSNNEGNANGSTDEAISRRKRQTIDFYADDSVMALPMGPYPSEESDENTTEMSE